MAGNSEQKKSRTKQNEKPPALEWLAAAIGFMLSCRNDRFSDLQRDYGRKHAAEIIGQNRFRYGKRRRLSRKIFSLQ